MGGHFAMAPPKPAPPTHAKHQRRRAKPSPTKPQARTFTLTAYTAQCPGCTGITATGLDVRNTIRTPSGLRVVAVDPDVIALGSILTIEFADGRTIKAKASDTGGAIDGMHIDLLVGSRAKAFDIGRQAVSVRVLTK